MDRPTGYASTAELFVSAPGSDSGQACRGSLFSPQRVTSSYAGLAAKRDMPERVIDELHPSFTPATLQENVSLGGASHRDPHQHGDRHRPEPRSISGFPPALAPFDCRTRLASGEKSGRKRMVTVAAVYDADPAVPRPQVVVLPGADRVALPAVRERPTAERPPRPSMPPVPHTARS